MRTPLLAAFNVDPSSDGDESSHLLRIPEGYSVAPKTIRPGDSLARTGQPDYRYTARDGGDRVSSDTHYGGL